MGGIRRCFICKVVFESIDALNDHCALTTHPIPHRCQPCGRAFQHLSGLQSVSSRLLYSALPASTFSCLKASQFLTSSTSQSSWWNKRPRNSRWSWWHNRASVSDHYQRWSWSRHNDRLLTLQTRFQQSWVIAWTLPVIQASLLSCLLPGISNEEVIEEGKSPYSLSVPLIPDWFPISIWEHLIIAQI